MHMAALTQPQPMGFPHTSFHPPMLSIHPCTRGHLARGWAGCVQAWSLSHVRLFLTLWTVAHQAPLSMGSPGKNTGVSCRFPPPGDLPDPGIEPTSPASPALQADSLLPSHQGSPKEWMDQVFSFLQLLSTDPLLSS